jgi:hypothetical protein
MQPNSTSLVSQLVLFSIKAAIALILFIVAVVVLMPDFSALTYSMKKATKDEKTRVALMSFIQNPAALYRASEIDEKAGKFNDAVMEMQLAIGLLEMHNANQLVIKRYATRLDQLTTKITTADEYSPSPGSAPGTLRPEPTISTFNGKPVKHWKE